METLAMLEPILQYIHDNPDKFAWAALNWLPKLIPGTNKKVQDAERKALEAERNALEADKKAFEAEKRAAEAEKHLEAERNIRKVIEDQDTG